MQIVLHHLLFSIHEINLIVREIVFPGVKNVYHGGVLILQMDGKADFVGLNDIKEMVTVIGVEASDINLIVVLEVEILTTFGQT